MKNNKKRFIVFLVTNIFVVSFIAFLAIMGFMIASETSNIMIVVNEGISKRTEAILNGEELSEPEKYFTQNFILEDNFKELLAVYERYKVTKYDYKLTLSSVWCWPGQLTKTLTVKEYIEHIEGYLPAANMTEEEQQIKGTIYPPEWKNGVWKITVRKEAGAWKIDEMTLIEEYDGPKDNHQHGTALVSPSPAQDGDGPSPSPLSGLRGKVDTGGDALNIRSGPSTQEELVTTVANGEIITILTRDDDGWHKVQVGSKIGYCLAEYIDIVE